MSIAETRWLAKFDDASLWTPFRLGMVVAVSYLLVRCAFDGLYLSIWGFPTGTSPLWQDSGWWTEVVNATLLGYIPAVLIVARMGVRRDLDQLRTKF